MVFGLIGVPCCGNTAHTFDAQLDTIKLYSVGAGWDLGLRIGSVQRMSCVFGSFRG